MLPILEGTTRNSFSLTTSGGKKKYAMSYTFHVDTGDIAHKAAEQIQQTVQKRYAGLAKFIRRKYRSMKIKKAASTMRKGLARKIKLDLPVSVRFQ